MLLHAEELQVRCWGQQMQTGRIYRHVEFLHASASSGVHGEKHLDSHTEPGQCFTELAEGDGVVYIGRPMESHQCVAGRKVFRDQIRSRWQELNKGIDHGVTDETDLAAGYTFANQV